MVWRHHICKSICSFHFEYLLYSTSWFTIYMQNTWETLGWKKHKLESVLPRDINNLRHADDTTLMAESEEELRASWLKWKSENADLKLGIQKTKIMAASTITSWQING